MDSELSALAATGATTIVSLMMTDAWERTKQLVSGAFGHKDAQAAEIVAKRLDMSQAELVAAQTSGDPEVVDELTAEWRGRLRRLLLLDPDAGPALQAALEQFSDELSPVNQSYVGRIEGKASGHGRVYQQGQGVQYNR